MNMLPDHFKIIDTSSTVLSGDILFPFAFDEVHCRKVGLGSSEPIIHIWRHQRAFVMGLRDRKLPHSLETMGWLESQAFNVTVRNSGGAAVPLDPGVVNISVIMPNPQGRMDFSQDFELMYQLIRGSLKGVSSKVEKGEIIGAYCPGDFDLSINGKKFCGIAQRRQTKAFVVQAFVIVEGTGEERGKLVEEFYQRASGGASDLNYPKVTRSSMASLTELTSISSSQEFINCLKGYLKTCGEVTETNVYDTLYEDEIQKTITELRLRYEKR